MASREKIREGIAKYFERTEYGWSALVYADKILEYLHSQGVVIKVDMKVRGKLVNALWDAVTEIKDMDECHAEVQKILDDAGLVATERLVEG